MSNLRVSLVKQGHYSLYSAEPDVTEEERIVHSPEESEIWDTVSAFAKKSSGLVRVFRPYKPNFRTELKLSS